MDLGVVEQYFREYWQWWQGNERKIRAEAKKMQEAPPAPHIVKVDRSRIVARQDCEMMRYWNYHHEGKGIVPRLGQGDALEFGIALHGAMEYILRERMAGNVPGVARLEIDHFLPFGKRVFDRMLLRENADHPKADHVSKEQAHLLRMLVLGWTHTRLPALLEEYDIVGVEKEYEVELPLRPHIHLMLRIDAILRRKADGMLHILDFKSLKYLSDDWMVHHENSLQTVLYLWALGKAEEEYIGGVLYEGLLKGGTRKETNKGVPWTGYEVSTSPLCYVYTDHLGHYKHQWTSAKGWHKIHLFDSTYDRVLQILNASYLEAGEGLPFWNTVPPVRPTDAQIEQVINAIALSESNYNGTIFGVEQFAAKGDLSLADIHRKLHIEQNLGRCYKYGTKYGCPYTSLCHGGSDPGDPTQWVPRTPHHDTEFEPDQPQGGE